MSGPKGVSYQVISAAELVRRRRQREISRLSAELSILRTEIAEFRGELSARGHTVAAPPDLTGAADVARLRDKVAVGRIYLAELRARVGPARAASARRQLAAALPSLRLTIELSSPQVEASAEAPAQSAYVDVLQARLTKAAVRVSELEDGARGRVISMLQTAEELADSPDLHRAETAVKAVEKELTQHLRCQQAAALLAEQRRSLSTEYADIAETHPELHSRVNAAEDGRRLADLRREFADVRAELEREADRAFVLTQAQEVLIELGYQVDVGRDTAAGLDRLMAKRPPFRSHGLELLFPKGQESFISRPVAFGATDSRDDVSFEQASCDDVDQMVATLQQRGVQVAVQRRAVPGAVPLLQAIPAHERSARAAAQERGLGG